MSSREPLAPFGIRERTFFESIHQNDSIQKNYPLFQMLHSLYKVPGTYLIEHYHTASWRPMSLKPKGLNLRKNSSGTVNTSIDL